MSVYSSVIMRVLNHVNVESSTTLVFVCVKKICIYNVYSVSRCVVVRADASRALLLHLTNSYRCHMHAYMLTHANMHTHTSCKRAHFYTHKQLCMQPCMHTRNHACTHAPQQPRPNTHAHIYTHTDHTCAHHAIRILYFSAVAGSLIASSFD